MKKLAAVFVPSSLMISFLSGCASNPAPAGNSGGAQTEQAGGGYRASYLNPFSGYTSQMGRNGAIKLKGAVIMDQPMGMPGYPAAL